MLTTTEKWVTSSVQCSAKFCTRLWKIVPLSNFTGLFVVYKSQCICKSVQDSHLLFFFLTPGEQMKKLEENMIICEHDLNFPTGVVWRVCVMLLLKLLRFAAVSCSQLYLNFNVTLRSVQPLGWNLPCQVSALSSLGMERRENKSLQSENNVLFECWSFLFIRNG